MTQHEINTLLSSITALEEIDIAKSMGETWPNQDLNALDVGGGVTVPQLVSLIKRVVAHTRNAIDDDPFSFPRHYYHPDNIRQSVDIISEFQNLTGNASSRQWHDASTRSRLIAHCLVLAGYWSKTAKRVHAVYEKKASELLSAAELKLSELNTTLVALRTEKEELIKQAKEARAELSEISDSLQAARSERQQITELVVQSTKDQAKLATEVAAGTQNLRAVEQLTVENQELLKELNATLKGAKEFYAKAQTDSDWIESKRKEITALVGKAADGSLGGTFRVRKDELDASVRVWRRITFLATVMAAAYVPFAFLIIPSPQVSDGLVLLANLGKILPVALFLGFVLRQYARERSFLEEYAFKTAVAFVVNAYADQLASTRFEKTLADFSNDQEQWAQYLEEREADRKKLIKETVDRLFASPQIHAEKAPSLVALRPKAAADILREAKELLAEARK